MTDLPDGTACEDGDVCTVGDVCLAGTCEPGNDKLCECKQDADCPDDGDKCNGLLECRKSFLPWVCATKPGSEIACDADTTCKQSKCEPTAGKCATTDVCSCTKQADCDAQQDANPCNGTLFCDSGTGICETNPSTVVKCSTDADTDCRKNTCLPSTGICAQKATAPSSPCEDGDQCTIGDYCAAGECLAGTNTCKCQTNMDCAAYDDGDKCNGIPFCDKSTNTCKPNPASIISCPSVDDTACLHNVCLPKQGTCTLVAAGEGEPCNDGDVCTSGEACSKGLCKPSAVTCKCQANADCAAKDDGDLCNGSYFCDKSLTIPDCAFNPASVVFCSKADDSACLQAGCDPKTGNCGLKPSAAAAPCDDGKPCTLATACDGKGSCSGGEANACDDTKPCTNDACVPGAGCQHKARSCDDGNACTADSCDVTTGQCVLQGKQDGSLCNADNDGCTVNDVCTKGVCQTGQKLSCVDNTEACQRAVCQSLSALEFKCVVVADKDGAPCPDTAGACWVGATCQAGKCAAGKTPRLWSQKAGKTGEDAWFRDVARRPDGSVVAVGGVAKGPVGKPTEARWLTQAFDALGAPLWTWVDDSQKDDPSFAAGAVVAMDDGTVWVAGAANLKAGPRLRLVRLSAAGTVLTASQVALDAAADEATHVSDLVAVPGGRLMALIDWRSGDGVGNNEVMLINADGTLVDSAPHEGGGLGMAVTGDHVMVMTNQTKNDDYGWGYAVVRASDLHEFNGVAPGPFGDYRAGALFTTGDKRFVTLLHPAKPGAALQSVLLSDAGVELGIHALTTKNAIPTAGVALADGGLVVGRTAGTSSSAWMARISRLGDVRWERTIDAGGPTALYGVTVLPDGGFIGAGAVSGIDGRRRPWLMRANDLGLSDCSQLGQCAGKTLASCDDGKPCTTDTCEPQVGCSHLAADELVCDPVDGCSVFGPCKLGKCTSAVNGRLHNVMNDWGELKGGGQDALLETSGGGVLSYSVVKTKVFLMQHDVFGRIEGPAEMPLCANMDLPLDVLPLFDGGVLITGHSGAGENAARGRVCRFGPTGKLTWSRQSNVGCSGSCGNKARAADEYIDGSIYVNGSRLLAGRYAAIVEKFDAAGKSLWSIAFGTSDMHVGGHSVIAIEDGGAVASGRGGGLNLSNMKGALMGVTPGGKQRFFKLIDAGYDANLAAVTRLSGGRVIAGGDTRPTNVSVRTSLLLAADALKGHVLWQRTGTPLDLSAFRAIAAEPTGGAVLAGNTKEGGLAKVFLERVDDAGTRIWRRTFLADRKYAASLGLHGLATWSGGYILGLRGHDEFAATIKTDFGGYDSCVGSGKCLGKPPTACDDTNKCTTDWCDAAGGCQHMAISGCE